MSEHTVYVFSSRRLGQGADDLGDILIRGFLRTVAKTEPYPHILIFLNSSVELLPLTEIQESLSALQQHGVKILACGTCIDYFKLREQIAPEWVSNMGEIVAQITNAAKVVNF